MKGKCFVVGICLAVGLHGTAALYGSVIVRVEPASRTVNVGDHFSVNIVADIEEPVVGWGLDLAFDHAVLAADGPPTIDSAWHTAWAPDGDGLIGLAFPDSISGQNVLLATVSLSAIHVGGTDLMLGVTPGDLNEGFPLYPSGFAAVSFTQGHVNVVPEPAGLLLIAGGLMVLCLGRTRRL
jgi:hypothetical protein